MSGLGAWLYLSPPSFLRVQEIVVLSPLKHLSEFDLVRLSQVQKGDPLLRLSLSKMRSTILRYPWIREVHLSKRFPGRLLIEVVEEEAVALLALEGLEGFYLVNRDGKVFKKMGAQDPKNFPIVTGLSQEDLTPLKEVLSLAHFFEVNKPVGDAGLSEIHWKGEEGVSVFTADPCVRIDLGARPWEGKLSRLSVAWESIMSATKKPKVVDLSLRKRIIVKHATL